MSAIYKLLEIPHVLMFLIVLDQINTMGFINIVKYKIYNSKNNILKNKIYNSKNNILKNKDIYDK
jgi:hypothetical protein